FGQRRGDDREHERQKHDAEEIPQQPQQREQDHPDDDAAIALIELVETEGAHRGASLHAAAPHPGLASPRIIRYLARRLSAFCKNAVFTSKLLSRFSDYLAAASALWADRSTLMTQERREPHETQHRSVGPPRGRFRHRLRLGAAGDGLRDHDPKPIEGVPVIAP